jgi:hypothetical protein
MRRHAIKCLIVGLTIMLVSLWSGGSYADSMGLAIR